MSLDSPEELQKWLIDLFPINRSLTGNGNLETLNYLMDLLPSLRIQEVKSGTEIFDWTVPDEWNIRSGFIELQDGSRIANFEESNLHIVGYSIPIDKWVSRSELDSHLHFLPDIPDAVPYITSYYKRDWGFCLSKNDYDLLGEGPFRVFIDSEFKNKQDGGSMVFADVILKGRTKQEVFFSTYICHPSMANNELSGPIVATALARYLSTIDHHYTYRFLFAPETIGSLVYLSKHLESLKRNVIAGWVLTCLGDSGDFSYMPSRLGTSYSDKCSQKLLSDSLKSFKRYNWSERGSDERQYCAPNIDLPICSITRSLYGTYPEYHTSLDNLNLVSGENLHQSLDFFVKLINLLEENRTPRILTLGEPFLSKRNLYPTISRNNSLDKYTIDLCNLISQLDGTQNLIEIQQKLGFETAHVDEMLELLMHNGLVEL